MKCLECQTPIVGRSDKRFCSDICRVRHHNKLSASFNSLKRQTHIILNQNRKILKKINDLGIKTISKKDLINHNFNFDYHTSVFHSPVNEIYYYCYDYGYCQLADNKLLVIKSNITGV